MRELVPYPVLAALFVVAVGGGLLLGEQSADARRRLGEEAKNRYRFERSAGVAQMEKVGLLRTLASIPPTRPFLVGDDLRTGVRSRLQLPLDGVYVSFSPSCKACRDMLPFLDSLAARDRFRVFAVVPLREGALLDSTLLRSAPPVCFVTADSGFLSYSLPTYVTPISEIYRDGKMELFLDRSPSTSERREWRDALQGRLGRSKNTGSPCVSAGVVQAGA